MPWRSIAKMLANQHQLVEMLANTPFMRRLAQMTHYAYRRATYVGQQKMNEMLKHEQLKRNVRFDEPPNGSIQGFATRFFKNIQTELEKANKLKPK